MTRLEYLKYAISKRCHHNKAWIVSAFAIIKEETPPYKVMYPGKILKKPWGFAFIDDDAKEVNIDATVDMESLFMFKEEITVDNTMCANVVSPTKTYLGNLLFNLICIVPPFDTKIPFITGKVSIPNIEDVLAAKLQSTPLAGEERSTEYFYVDEYIKFCDSLSLISSLSQLATYAATPKNVKAPTGIKEFKQTLLVKYAGKLTDPVELAKFEKELTDFDAAYMEGDPSNNLFVAGKIKDIARKKMFLSIGSEKTFEDSLKANPIINSLEEGWPTEPKLFTPMLNNARMASFSRGAETVKGGVSAKILLRAANSFKIVDTDCETKLGIRRVFTKGDIHQLVGRTLVDVRSTFVENNDVASNYLNKSIIVRSPMYCKLEGDKICKICAGTKLSSYPTGLTIPVTEISSILLATFMKAMHSQVLSTAKLDLNRIFS